MKKLYLSAIITAIFFSQIVGQNKSKLSPFTRVILNAQKDTALVQKSLLRTLLKNETREIETIGVFIEFYENADFSALENLGVEINSVAGKIVTAKIPVFQIENAAALPSVRRIEAGVPVNLKMDAARSAGRVDSVHQGRGVFDFPYKGKNVV
ncbi:MAG: hypothetical protein LBB53_02400, partial [Prevotellaceae bacterium]|nr:hypothetical protein [Prevotellaceae bacterium]